MELGDFCESCFIKILRNGEALVENISDILRSSYGKEIPSDPSLILLHDRFLGAPQVLLEYFKYKKYLPGSCAFSFCTMEEYTMLFKDY